MLFLLLPFGAFIFSLWSMIYSKLNGLSSVFFSGALLLGLIEKYFRPPMLYYPKTWIPILGNFEIVFDMSSINIAMGILISALWFFTCIYNIGYVRVKKLEFRFDALISLTILCSMGLVFSSSLITAFIFYELLSIVTYWLVAFGSSKEDIASARSYLLILMFASIGLLLPCIIYIHMNVGHSYFSSEGILHDLPRSHASWLFLLMMLGIAKAGLWPFYGFIRRAVTAHVPVSALLHSAAVVKGGVFLALKVTHLVFGHDLVASFAGSFPFLLLNVVILFTALSATIFASTTRLFKKILAFSTVEKLAQIMFLIVNLFSVQSCLYYIIFHSLCKCAFFFCYGCAYMRSGATSLDNLGISRHSTPVLYLCTMICIFCLIGVMPGLGAHAKEIVMKAFSSSWYAAVIFYLTAALNAFYMMRIFYYINVDDQVIEIKSVRPIPRSSLVATFCLTSMCLLAGPVISRIGLPKIADVIVLGGRLKV